MNNRSQNSLLFYLTFPFFALFIVMLLAGVFFSKTFQTSNMSNIEIARSLYSRVDATILAQVDHEEYIKAIEERIICYTKHYIYTERVNICGSSYQKNIIKIASKTTNKRPMVGKFVMKLNECPIMFNMCRGKKKTIEECVVFEKRCIDFFLDKYWRGAWETSLKGNLAE